MNSFSIKDIAHLSGIKTHTLRVWETRYNLFSPDRTDSNIRRYNNEELKKILNISLLNKHGFKISRINEMTNSQMEEKIFALPHVREDKAMHILIMAMFEMDVSKFEKQLQKIIDEQGLKTAITNVIWPFLQKVGVLWTVNHIIPAQEHLVTNIVRQKLLAGIDKASTNSESEHRLLLFLPPGEFHEIGLLFLSFLLREQGCCVLYMGCDVPLKDLVATVTATNPSAVYTHLTNGGKNFQPDLFIKKIRTAISDIPLILSGSAFAGYKKQQPLCSIMQSFNEMQLHIAAL